MKVKHGRLKIVQKLHALGNIDGKIDHLTVVYAKVGLIMKHIEKRAKRHALTH